jgi:hypothetical protein
MTHLRHSRLLMVLSEIHTDRLGLVAIESFHADRSGPDGRRGVDVRGKVRHLDPPFSASLPLTTTSRFGDGGELKKTFGTSGTKSVPLV